MPSEVRVDSKIRYHNFDTATRQISLRNVGCNTLWVSFDRKNWHDVACGTSWDDRVSANGFWHCTQTGKTGFVVIGLQMNLCDTPIPAPTAEELEV